MLKAVLMFVGGNALWDKLVEYFGSTDAIIEAAVGLVAVIFILKFIKQIIWLVGFVVVSYFVWTFLH